jgi:Domain of unknown function (DUF4159)
VPAARSIGFAGAAARMAIGLAVVASAVLTTGSAELQRRGQRGRGAEIGRPWVYDGRFVFCRLAFRESFDGDGGGWAVDYPKADLNFPFRLGELTETPISHDAGGNPNHVIVTPTDPHLFQCPFVMMTEVGAAFFDEADAQKLREYLTKGGFLWADDFWGEYAWHVWEREIRKVLPPEYPIVDLPLDHQIFNISYVIRKIPQIPSIDFWFRSGFQTSERADSRVPHVRAIEDDRGNVVVLMTHNTDFGDAFEREGEDRRFFDRFAAESYSFGVNVYLYAMTH